MKIELTIIVELDDYLFIDCIKLNDNLDEYDKLYLHSNMIGDTIGEVIEVKNIKIL